MVALCNCLFFWPRYRTSKQKKISFPFFSCLSPRKNDILKETTQIKGIRNMSLEMCYKKTDFTHQPSWLQEILSEITLTDFKRNRTSTDQMFHFTFSHKGELHTLHHTFCYHGAGLTHSFKWNSGLFPKKPFKLSKEELISFSNALMPAVNKWTPRSHLRVVK